MGTTTQTLKEINDQKRILTERQRDLRRELNDSKEERKEARKLKAELRRSICSSKAELRTQIAGMYSAMIDGPESLADITEDFDTSSRTLVASLRRFADVEIGL